MAADRADGMIPLFAAAAIAYGKVFSTRRSEELSPSVDGARFELNEGAATLTQLAVEKANFERVLAKLRSNPLEL